VVRPPADARLIDAATTRETLVRYDLGAEGTLEYRARNGCSRACAECAAEACRNPSI
jgi:hypothetical protein